MTEQLSFKVAQVEGPLDLILQLISKHKLNIYDIEIAKLLEQYLDYVEQMQSQQLEVASEFWRWHPDWCTSNRFRCCPSTRS